MSTATLPRTMTLEEMDALPEDGKDRELIRGELRERPITRRNRWQSKIETRIARFLDVWLDTQQQPRGVIASVEAEPHLPAFRLDLRDVF